MYLSWSILGLSIVALVVMLIQVIIFKYFGTKTGLIVTILCYIGLILSSMSIGDRQENLNRQSLDSSFEVKVIDKNESQRHNINTVENKFNSQIKEVK